MFPYENPALTPEERTADLLGRMTLREKIGQLNQRLYGFRCYTRRGEEIALTREFQEEVAHYSGLGALYGLHRADPWADKDYGSGLTGALSPKASNLVQKYVLEHSRLRIPVLMSTECPHGPQVLDGALLPVNLAAGASFSPELVEAAAERSGAQLRELGVHLALVSALDVLRDPRWGRSEECFGEDPYLASRMGEAVVRGIRSQGVAVVAKHLCAQGETTGGVNASAARIGQRELREIHLPPVESCARAGAEAFMAAYNEIDGVYCHANPALLTDYLRGELGFQGFVMSDGVAIDQLDAVTGDRTVSGAAALNAGVDMGLWDTGFRRLEEAVAQGLVDEKRIDQAAGRILLLKFRMGLFENPFVPETDHYAAFRVSGKALAEQTPVLLKNPGILPLSLERPGKIFLTGPNADALYNQLGDYTPPVREGITLRQGLEALLKDAPAELAFHPGSPMFCCEEAESRRALSLAADCDAIIYAAGGSSSRFAGQGEFDTNGAMLRQNGVTMDCGENVDSSTLLLPGRQLEEIAALKALGKPVIVIVIAGRPYAMEALSSQADALIYSFYPGPWGGEVLAKLLFGLLEPGGRLPVSLPADASRLPVYYNPKDSYRPMAYYDGKNGASFSFGEGLSYTRFRYTLLDAPQGEERPLRFLVENTGARPGYAVPQLYLHRTQGVATSRVRQLCGFQKAYLAPGECREMTIPVPRESLTQFDAAMRRCLPKGRIQWFLKDCGETLLEGEFTV